MPLKIAFVGKNKSGRTWAADYLRVHHDFKKLSLNEGVDKMMRTFYYYGDHKRIPWEVRLRVYDALYEIDPSIWIGYLERRLRTTTRDVVVDDPRYLNEINALKDLGFTVIRLTAPETRRRRFLKGVKNAPPGVLAVHELFNRNFLEAAKVDYSIYNETKDGTRKALDEIVKTLRKLDIE